MSRLGCASLCLCLLLSCSSTRKLSQVGLREPASVKDSAHVSELRSRVMTLKQLPAACPKEIRENFAALAAEKVSFPECPASLQENFQSAVPHLKLEERSTMEEVISSHCRSLGLNEFGESLETLLANFDSTGPIGRRSKLTETLTEVDGEAKTLANLRDDIQTLVNYHLPLDRWLRRNGDYVLPEEELEQLYRLVMERACRMNDQEVDQIYHTIRSLEELAKVLKEGPQEDRIDTFLVGVHQVVEHKIKEFFYP